VTAAEQVVEAEAGDAPDQRVECLFVRAAPRRTAGLEPTPRMAVAILQHPRDIDRRGGLDVLAGPGVKTQPPAEVGYHRFPHVHQFGGPPWLHVPTSISTDQPPRAVFAPDT